MESKQKTPGKLCFSPQMNEKMRIGKEIVGL